MTTYHFADLEEINVPLLFLDDDTKRRLRGHDGPIQMLYTNGGWQTLQDEPRWYPGLIYRAAPVPKTKPAPPVEHLADWIKWWAKDEGEEVWGFSVKPYWAWGDWRSTKGRTVELTDGFKFDVGTCDAKDSLVCRADVEGGGT